MTSDMTDTNKNSQNDPNPLMETYNPLPAQAEQPARFYWQEPWHGAASEAGSADVQAAFEN